MCHESDIAIAITTAPRKVPTLGAMLDGVRMAGFHQLISVFAEPGSDIPKSHNCRIIRRDETCGITANWMLAAEEMLASSPRYVLMLEDDVLLSEDAGSALEFGLAKYCNSRLGFLSLFTPRMNAIQSDKNDCGWSKLSPSSALWGALAWCFPAHSLRLLLRSRTLRNAMTKTHGLDAAVGHVLDIRRMDCYQHFPSLGLHIGYTSTVGHRQRRGSEAVGWPRDLSGTRHFGKAEERSLSSGAN